MPSDKLKQPKKKLNAKPFKKQTLAERVTASIEESIVSGAWEGGDALPTEPEIARQFGVSRAVVRDATRMLAAKGLVEARHGKGVFVTHSPIAPFGDALLLALRRLGATNWDVTEFEQMLFPEVVALAAQNATEADLGQLREAAEAYLAMQRLMVEIGVEDQDSAEFQQFKQTWTTLSQAIFDATHNKLISLLAQPLMNIRSLRHWTGLPDSMDTLEARLINSIIDLIAAHDPTAARRKMNELLTLPPEAVAAMKRTPVGEVTHIVLNSNPSDRP